MTTKITYRASATATPPGATLVKGTPLDNLEVDANFKTLDDEINLKESLANKDANNGYAGLTLFKHNMRNAANTVTSWITNAATVARTWTMPDKDGTVAMTSDITGINSGTNTGDETLATIKLKLGITTLSGSNTGDQTNISGNAATATTAASCSGNAATATTAASCSGNAATATTAGNVTGVVAIANGGTGNTVGGAKSTCANISSYSTNFTAVAGYHYVVGWGGTTQIITLPATPSIGDTIYFSVDLGGSGMQINPGTKSIQGTTGNMILNITTQRQTFGMKFTEDSVATGWCII